jgi:hypothetical protein
VAASHIDHFENLYHAQQKLFQHTKTPYIELYGIRLRITPLPNAMLTGTELRTKLHTACDALF